MRLLFPMALGCLIAASAVVRADDADVAAGKTLYIDNCQRCHGNTGQGGLGLKLKGDAAYWDFAIFKRAVMTGYNDDNKKMKALMPIWGTTGFANPKGVIPTDQDLQNIQTYLKTFGPKTAD